MNEPLRGAPAQEAVREFLQRYRIAFEMIEDPRGPTAPITVLERLTGKSVRFAIPQVLVAEEAKNTETGSPYLRLELDDGRRFALALIGIVFSPSFVATGPVPDCPATACFTDFNKLHRHLDHLADDAHEEHKKEALQVLMVLLAFLEGARAAGIDVAEEERELDVLLEKLER
jgi:hypothetical protein